MQHVSFPLSIKNLSENGELEGLAAGYGNVDSHGETFAPGAFTKSLRTGGPVAMLLHHNMRQPIGRWDSLTETTDGLKAVGTLALAAADGGDAYALLKAGALRGLSVGYRGNADRAGVIAEAQLFEISLVTIPSNPRTYVDSVKSTPASARELEDHLRDIGISGRRAKAAAAMAFRAADEAQDEQILSKAAERLAASTRNIATLMGV